MHAFDVESIRKDFPILHHSVRGKRLAYLDNAASTQKPSMVIDRIKYYYEHEHSNIHRGVHYLSEVATQHYEQARIKIKNFIKAASHEEIIFTRGTTESINLVAQSYGKNFIKADDEILISTMEHHSNIVPWQLLCEQTGAKLKIIPINERGEIILEAFGKMLSEKVKLLALCHISNSLGTINPVALMISQAHQHGIPVLLDAAQSIQHIPIDVQKLDCDFLAFSGHKIYGPTGIGVLYGKKAFLEKMPPYQGGGDMILEVSFAKTTYNHLPHKFEAGTPHIAGAIALGTAIDYLQSFDFAAACKHEQNLLRYCQEALREFKSLKFIGTAALKTSVVSFVLDDIHPHDIGTILDQQGVAIRTGHHCTMPLMQFFKVPATARVSLAFYNTREDIDQLVAGMKKVFEVFNV